MDRDASEFGRILRMLLNRTHPPVWYRPNGEPKQKEKLVILLGAGCSMQYGLPSFRELLSYLHQDLYHQTPDSNWSFEVLRDKLDKDWQSMGPGEQNNFLSYYLGRVQGNHCLGYVQLARLAAKEHVAAIINMNFDTLLEDALTELDVSFRVSTSFCVAETDQLIVFKPHGTIGSDLQLIGSPSNPLILDIAHSELFSDPKEKPAARKLLTDHDVVSIGYSGVDTKIAEALAPEGQFDPKTKKLFVVALRRPDPRLLFTMAQRGSQELLIVGEDATFENFMDGMVQGLESWEQGDELKDEPAPRLSEPTYMTRSERRALAECLRLAMEIRLSLDVADRSATSIEEHGYNIYHRCQQLAVSAGICLTSPERYLLHCAAFLHDLGYYRGYSRGKAHKNTGWNLLLKHGEMTKDLLKERHQDDKIAVNAIIPSSYYDHSDEIGRESFIEALANLCAWHTSLKLDSPFPDFVVPMYAVNVPVRFALTHILFATAEELTERHPFLASADPFPALVEDGTFAISDPILDIFLRRKKDKVSFEVERGRVRGKLLEPISGGEPSSASICFFTMAALFVERLNRITLDPCYGGWGIKFDCGFAVQVGVEFPEGFSGFIEEALRERLEEGLSKIPPNSLAETDSRLDLLAVYTLRPQWQNLTEEANYREPRVSLDQPIVEDSLRMIKEKFQGVSNPLYRGLLDIYFPLKSRQNRNELGVMEQRFIESFETIIHPAWRFFARNWHAGTGPILVAPACLDLGSSRFRGEVFGGLRDLLGERVFWDEDCEAYAHDYCTLCTARLLYVLAASRRLFLFDGGLNRLANNEKRKGLDDTVKGLLAYLLGLPQESEAWWGFKSASTTIESADCLAWAARAVLFCCAVDDEIKSTTGENWLEESCGTNRQAVETLLRQRWVHLLGITKDQMIQEWGAETHSIVLGQVALACLDLQWLGKDLKERAIDGNEAGLRDLASKLREAQKQIRPFSRLSQMYWWPGLVLSDNLSPSLETAREAVDYCQLCINSPFWIRGGTDSGTWGYNLNKTLQIVTPLVAFWRHVYKDHYTDQENELRFIPIFEELGSAKGT